MKKMLISILMILLIPGIQGVFASDIIGYIDAVNGKVELVRDGEVYDAYDLKEGDDIENYDLIRTKSKGEMTIVINSKLCPETTITVSENTTFTIEVSKLKSKNQSTLGMITGSLALQVKGLTTDQGFNVESEGSVCGVRGTSFEIGSSPEGDLLVTCEEGDVECVDESGNSAHAVPGEAVEQKTGELFKKIPFKLGDHKNFRRKWNAERIEAFKPNALRAIRRYAIRYAELIAKFEREYKTLMKRASVIKKWEKEKKEKKTGGKMEMMKDKKLILGPLFRIRRTLFILEKVYFRLVELQDYYNQGYGKGDIKKGLSVQKFFEDLEKSGKELHKKVAKVRFIMKLYAERNDGGFPTDDSGADDDSSEEADDFFGEN